MTSHSRPVSRVSSRRSPSRPLSRIGPPPDLSQPSVRISVYGYGIDDVSEIISAKEKRIQELQKLVDAETVKEGKHDSSKSSTPKPGGVESNEKENLKGKKISPEEQEAMLQRLTRTKKSTELPPVPGYAPKTIDRETLDAMVSRLGEEDLVKRKSNYENLESSLIQPLAKAAAIEQEELVASANRLSSTKSQQAAVAALREELLQPIKSSQKVISKSKVDDCTHRLHDDSTSHKKKTLEEIHEKYVSDLLPTSKLKKLSPDRQKAMADRLSKRG